MSDDSALTEAARENAPLASELAERTEADLRQFAASTTWREWLERQS
jgi:hypothetical protein